MAAHEPFDIDLEGNGWAGTCACGAPVEYVGAVRSGEWQHREPEQAS